MSIWDKFNKQVDLNGLQDDIKNAEENTVDFEEVPFGKYEVSVEKMEMKESKNGKPMLSIWFKIIEGSQKGKLLFYNQVLLNGIGIHKASELLRSMETGIDVKFKDYVQFENVIKIVYEFIENAGLEFALQYSQTSKGYKEFEIEEVFES